jgi:hypothetical protein
MAIVIVIVIVVVIVIVIVIVILLLSWATMDDTGLDFAFCVVFVLQA